MKTFCAKGNGQCSCAKFHDDPNNCERGVPIMKTSTLTGADLNAAVAMALGHKVWRIESPYIRSSTLVLSTHGDIPCWMQSKPIPYYSEDIREAWPIIKERCIGFYPPAGARRGWEAFCQPDSNKYELVAHEADDPLVAALRVVVLIAYGDEVELP